MYMYSYRPLRLINLSCWNSLGLPTSRILVSYCREYSQGCHTTRSPKSFSSLFTNSFLERCLLSANSHQTISNAVKPVMVTAGVHTATQHNHRFVIRTNAGSISLFIQPNCSFSTSSTFKSSNTSQFTNANRTTLKYIISIAIVVVGLSYAAVPLYRVFCQASGYGGTTALAEASEKVENMEPIRERELTIRFNADTSAAMLWHFKPHQNEIKLVPGETALAFYTARNPTDRPVTGIATYNVIPFEAGIYFNKIQCFCFEEQRLNPKEQVDMPVFFYIDPEFNDDPAMAKVDSITLSYTFFEAKEEENIQAATM